MKLINLKQGKHDVTGRVRRNATESCGQMEERHEQEENLKVQSTTNIVQVSHRQSQAKGIDSASH